MSNYTYENYTYGRLYEVLGPYKEPYEGKGTKFKFNGGFLVTIVDNVDWANDISYGLIARIIRGDDNAVLLFNDVLCIVESFSPSINLDSLNNSHRDVNIPHISCNDFEDPLQDKLFFDLIDVITRTKHVDDEEEERGTKMDTTQEAYKLSNSLYKEFSNKNKELKKLFYDEKKYNKAKEVLYDDICTKHQNELTTFTEYYLMDKS